MLTTTCFKVELTVIKTTGEQKICSFLHLGPCKICQFIYISTICYQLINILAEMLHFKEETLFHQNITVYSDILTCNILFPIMR